MDTILVHAESEDQVNFIKSFLDQHKVKSRILSEEDKEDFVLSRLMEETNYDDMVDTDNFLQKLRS